MNTGGDYNKDEGKDDEHTCNNKKVRNNRCFPELGKCGVFPAYREVQTSLYRFNFMVHCHSQENDQRV